MSKLFWLWTTLVSAVLLLAGYKSIGMVGMYNAHPKEYSELSEASGNLKSIADHAEGLVLSIERDDKLYLLDWHALKEKKSSLTKWGYTTVKYFKYADTYYVDEIVHEGVPILSFYDKRSTLLWGNVKGSFFAVALMLFFIGLLIYMDKSIPLMIKKSHQRTAVILTENGLFTDLGEQKYEAKLNGFKVLAIHRVKVSLSKYGNHDSLQVLVLLNEHYTEPQIKQIGYKLDIDRKEGKAYLPLKYELMGKRLKLDKLNKMIIDKIEEASKIIKPSPLDSNQS